MSTIYDVAKQAGVSTATVSRVLSGPASAVAKETRQRVMHAVKRLGLPSVHIDNTKAASEAMDHLYQLGHRRIGLITGPLVSPLSRDRLDGAMQRARAAGAEDGVTVLHGDFTIEAGTAAADVLLS